MIQYIKGKVKLKYSEGKDYAEILIWTTKEEWGSTNSVRIASKSVEHINEGEIIEIWAITEYSRDGATTIGFLELSKLMLALELERIPGVGLRTAGIVSEYLEEEILKNIANTGEIAPLLGIPGIGKKTAIRIASELYSGVSKKTNNTEQNEKKWVRPVRETLRKLGFAKEEIDSMIQEKNTEISAKGEFDPAKIVKIILTK